VLVIAANTLFIFIRYRSW